MGKVRRDWFEIFAASECQASAKAADLGEITASDIVRQAMAKLSTLNIDGPEAVASAVQALNDMHKAGALRVRPPVSHTVTVSTPIKGWNFKPSEGANIEGTGYLVRAKDGVLIRASGDRRVWEKQIVDFEFLEGIEWTPQQIAAITDPGHTHDISVVQHESVSISPTQEVPFVKGGHYDPTDSERYGCHLTWWPDELHIPFFSGEKGTRTLHIACPTSGMPTYYDVSYDERRPITQEIVDNMERGIQKLIAERHENRSDKAPDALHQACERQARVLGDAANEIARLFEVAKERNALIASLGRSGAAQADEIAMLRTELMAARDTISATMAQRIDWHDAQLAARDARIAELDTRLASTPVAFEDPDARPAASPGFLSAIRQGNKATVGILTKPGDMPRSG